MIFDIINQYNKIAYPQVHFSKTDLFFFLHMPKTAGTTFRHILYNHVDQNQILPSRKTLHKTLNGRYMSAEEMISSFDMQELHQHYHIVCGHYGIKFQEHFSTPPKVITFLREPYERTISHLKHLKTKNHKYTKHSLIDIWEENKELLQNFQSKRLGYLPKKDNKESFLQTVDDVFFIGLTETFEQSLKQLNELTGWKLKNIAKKNKTAISTSELPDDVSAKIKEHLQLDYLIYKHLDSAR